MVADKFKHIVSNLREDWERHDFLFIAVSHVVDVWVWCRVMRNGFFCKLVENMLVNVVRRLLILLFTFFVVSIQSLNQLLECLLENLTLYELLNRQSVSLYLRTSPGQIDRFLFL